jgi:uncharacterized protein (DUF1778 family)
MKIKLKFDAKTMDALIAASHLMGVTVEEFIIASAYVEAREITRLSSEISTEETVQLQ